ncbi:hypothetical protein BH20ACT2_BH20ACT2_13620 [soil metagenome]
MWRSPWCSASSGSHLAFAVGSSKELRRWAERFTAAGVSHEGVTEIPPGATLNFKDPDGIAVALLWDRD